MLNQSQLCADILKSNKLCLHMRLLADAPPAGRGTVREQVERVEIYPLILLPDRVNMLLRLDCQTVCHENCEAASLISP